MVFFFADDGAYQQNRCFYYRSVHNEFTSIFIEVVHVPSGCPQGLLGSVAYTKNQEQFHVLGPPKFADGQGNWDNKTLNREV